MQLSKFFYALRLATLLCVASGLSLATQAGSAEPPCAPHCPQANPAHVKAFAQAMQAYEDSHWEQAYARLSALANVGHPDAARIVLQMHRYGPQLYKTRFSATPFELAMWKRAICCTA